MLLNAGHNNVAINNTPDMQVVSASIELITCIRRTSHRLSPLHVRLNYNTFDAALPTYSLTPAS